MVGFFKQKLNAKSSQEQRTVRVDETDQAPGAVSFATAILGNRHRILGQTRDAIVVGSVRSSFTHYPSEPCHFLRHESLDTRDLRRAAGEGFARDSLPVDGLLTA